MPEKRLSSHYDSLGRRGVFSRRKKEKRGEKQRGLRMTLSIDQGGDTGGGKGGGHLPLLQRGSGAEEKGARAEGGEKGEGVLTGQWGRTEPFP